MNIYVRTWGSSSMSNFEACIFLVLSFNVSNSNSNNFVQNKKLHASFFERQQFTTRSLKLMSQTSEEPAQETQRDLFFKINFIQICN